MGLSILRVDTRVNNRFKTGVKNGDDDLLTMRIVVNILSLILLHTN